MEDLETLNTPVPSEWVGEDIDQLMREMDRAVQLVDAWLKNVNIGLNGIKFGLRTLLTFMSVAHPHSEICNCVSHSIDLAVLRLSTFIAECRRQRASF
jgi:hypothetical protein